MDRYNGQDWPMKERQDLQAVITVLLCVFSVSFLLNTEGVSVKTVSVKCE